MSRSRLFALVALVGCGSEGISVDARGSLAGSSTESAPAADQGATVDSVQVVVGRPSHGAVTGVVDAPLHEVLAIVLDCDASDTWFPDVHDTRVVSRDGGSVRCEGRTDLPWPMPDRTWQIDSHAEGADRVRTVPFTLVDGSGNVEELHGGYRLEDLGDGRTRVTYEVDVDIGVWIPGFVAEWATRRVLPAILDGIEETHEVRASRLAGI